MAVFWTEPTNSNSQFAFAVTSNAHVMPIALPWDTQLRCLPYMTRLDVFFLVSTLLVFFSLIEVLSRPFSDIMTKLARAEKTDPLLPVSFL